MLVLVKIEVNVTYVITHLIQKNKLNEHMKRIIEAKLNVTYVIKHSHQ